MNFDKLFVLIYLILSTMIGVGTLALPYAVYLTGIIPSIILFIFAGFLTYIASLILLKTSLRCYKFGLSSVFENYLGEKLGLFSNFLIVFSIIFVCVIYLNIIAFALKNLLKNPETYTLLISALSLSIIYSGFSIFEKFEGFLFLLKIFFLAIFLVFILLLPKRFEIEYFIFDPERFSRFLLISIFSLSFYTIIPYLLYITKEEKLLKKSIVASIIIGLAIYIPFAILVSYKTGDKEISTLNLIEIFNILTILFVITPYISLSWTLADIFSEKFKTERNIAVLSSFVIQLFLFVFLPKGFIFYLELVSGIFIILTYMLIGLIGLKFHRSLQINPVLSLILIIFSLILFLFKILDLVFL